MSEQRAQDELKTQLLVVDDSAVARLFLAKAIDAEPDLALIGLANNGRVALEQIERRRPDLIVLDLEMPEMDGIATLRMLRERHPSIPVIVFSALSERGATLTIEALQLGARDYLLKPAGMGSAGEAFDYVRRELLVRARELGRPRPTSPAAQPRPRPAVSESPTPSPASRRSGAVEAIAIAASTGGPLVLSWLLENLPMSLAAPVFIVQHLPASFIDAFVARLDGRVGLTIRVGRTGARPRPGEVWFAPGDHHMVVQRDANGLVLGLEQSPPLHGCRPAADVLFRSLARSCGSTTLAVVLTGMGRDGCDGAIAIDAAGGRVFAQDRASAVVWSMPGAVVEAGVANEVVELDQLAVRIERACAR